MTTQGLVTTQRRLRYRWMLLLVAVGIPHSATRMQAVIPLLPTHGELAVVGCSTLGAVSGVRIASVFDSRAKSLVLALLLHACMLALTLRCPVTSLQQQASANMCRTASTLALCYQHSHLHCRCCAAVFACCHRACACTHEDSWYLHARLAQWPHFTCQATVMR